MMHIFGCEDFHFKNVTIVHLPFQLLTINFIFFHFDNKSKFRIFGFKNAKNIKFVKLIIGYGYRNDNVLFTKMTGLVMLVTTSYS